MYIKSYYRFLVPLGPFPCSVPMRLVLLVLALASLCQASGKREPKPTRRNNVKRKMFAPVSKALEPVTNALGEQASKAGNTVQEWTTSAWKVVEEEASKALEEIARGTTRGVEYLGKMVSSDAPVSGVEMDKILVPENQIKGMSEFMAKALEEGILDVMYLDNVHVANINVLFSEQLTLLALFDSQHPSPNQEQRFSQALSSAVEAIDAMKVGIWRDKLKEVDYTEKTKKTKILEAKLAAMQRLVFALSLLRDRTHEITWQGEKMWPLESQPLLNLVLTMLHEVSKIGQLTQLRLYKMSLEDVDKRWWFGLPQSVLLLEALVLQTGSEPLWDTYVEAAGKLIEVSQDLNFMSDQFKFYNPVVKMLTKSPIQRILPNEVGADGKINVEPGERTFTTRHVGALIEYINVGTRSPREIVMFNPQESSTRIDPVISTEISGNGKTGGQGKAGGENDKKLSSEDKMKDIFGCLYEKPQKPPTQTIPEDTR